VQSTIGDGATSYGFTGEATDSSGLVYLRARYYHPYLNRFIQPDPIVPNSSHPWEWNRYTYARNNPVRYIDPSGMLSCYDGDDPDCQISIDLVKQFAEATKIGVENGAFIPVEGFAQTVDFTYWLFRYDYRGMMWALTLVINGFDPNAGAVWAQVGSRSSPYFIRQDWLPYKHNPQYDDPNWGGGEGVWIHSLRGDWNEAYWDKTANQAFHFWFYAAVAFFDGSAWGGLGNVVHDPPINRPAYDYIHSPEDESPPPSGNSKPDYDLGVKGIELGSKMRKEYLDFYLSFGDCPWFPIPALPPLSFDPGNWIRTNLK
jgi:RHS repeat-associated protein